MVTFSSIIFDLILDSIDAFLIPFQWADSVSVPLQNIKHFHIVLAHIA